MKLNALKQLLYGLYLTNSFGWKLKKRNTSEEKKRLRLAYAKAQIDALNLSIIVEYKEKLPTHGQYIVVVNHRSIIDPPIIELALAKSNIFGLWIAKKELYHSFFFGLFVRHAGSILVDREKNQIRGFFTEIKEAIKEGHSIFIFPEGTRNKTEKDLSTFKEGARMIALKNKLAILPIYIQTNSDIALKDALKDKHLSQDIIVSVGDLIAYKDRTSLEEMYKKRFNLED